MQDGIKQHIPKAIRNQTQPDRDLSQSNPTSISVMGKHFFNNAKCASYYDDNQFAILATGRTLIYLLTLETTLIKMLKPELCRQKEFVYTLQLLYIIDLDSMKHLVVYQSKRFGIFTDLNRYKYVAINTRLHSCDSS